MSYSAYLFVKTICMHKGHGQTFHWSMSTIIGFEDLRTRQPIDDNPERLFWPAGFVYGWLCALSQ
jgi:hypothetical protein